MIFPNKTDAIISHFLQKDEFDCAYMSSFVMFRCHGKTHTFYIEIVSVETMPFKKMPKKKQKEIKDYSSKLCLYIVHSMK